MKEDIDNVELFKIELTSYEENQISNQILIELKIKYSQLPLEIPEIKAKLIQINFSLFISNNINQNLEFKNLESLNIFRETYKDVLEAEACDKFDTIYETCH